ncbi:MAG: hypothetical protein MZV70_53085 [Desulfobacterales bacterium]|nr:hypothetical protein [Desulfobacterales bacterium]
MTWYQFLFQLRPFILNVITLSGFSKLEDKLNQEKEKSEKVGPLSGALHTMRQEAKILLDTEHDKLGQAQAALHNSLARNKEEAALRKKEDDQRNWVADGLAKFSEILRENNDNIEELSYQVVSKTLLNIWTLHPGRILHYK